MKRRKVTAALLAALLGISSAPAGVLAADSYKETEKAAFTKAVEKLAAGYGEDLDAYKTALSDSGNVEFKLSLADTGRAILGMMLPSVDVSWLSDASVMTNVTVAENKVAEWMDVYVNDTKICSVEYYIDPETMDVYMKIPELADGYLKMNMEESIDTAVQDGTAASETPVNSDTAAEYARMMEIYSAVLENLPEADVVENLLNRYGTMILDNVSDVSAADPAPVDVGGVSQELTALTASVTQKEAIPMMAQILDTAKTDEELKTLVETYSEILDDPEYTYDTFTAKIEELEAELSDPDETDESGLVLTTWVDGQGNIAGRRVAVMDYEYVDEQIIGGAEGPTEITVTDGTDEEAEAGEEAAPAEEAEAGEAEAAPAEEAEAGEAEAAPAEEAEAGEAEAAPAEGEEAGTAAAESAPADGTATDGSDAAAPEVRKELQEQFQITWLSSESGNQRSFHLEMGDDSSWFAIEGSGELTDNVLNGTYTFSSNGIAVASCDVQGYDTAAMEDGILKGTYTISSVPVEYEDGTSYDALGGMSIEAIFDGGEEEGSMELSLLASGAYIGTLSASTAQGGETLPYPDVSTFENVYDMSSNEDGDRFAQDMSLDTIMDNLTAAGMPDGFIEDLTAALSGSDDSYSSDGEYGSDGSEDAYYGIDEYNEQFSGEDTEP